MAFWGVELKPGRPFTISASNSQARLHVSQATLGIGNAKNKSIVQCNVGDKSPVFLCALSPDKVESCQLNLEFEEAVEVIFSVIGPRSVHLTGYYLNKKMLFTGNDDDSETYGEDIVDTETERSSAENDYDYSDSFINDDNPSICPDARVSDSDDELTINERAEKMVKKKTKGKSRRLRKKYQVSDSDADENWKFGAFSGVTDSSAGSSAQLDDTEIEREIESLPSSEDAPSPRHTISTTRDTVNGKTDSKTKKTVGAEAHHILDVPDLRGGKSSCDLLQSSKQGDQKSPSKKKSRKETQNSSVEVKSGVEGDTNIQNVSKGVQDEKTVIETAKPLNKKRKGQERSVDKQNISKCTNEIQAVDKDIEREVDKSMDRQEISTKASKKCRKGQDEANIDKSESGKDVRDNEDRDSNGKPPELETLSNGLLIEELAKGNLDGKSAVKGKKVSIIYFGKLKENGQVFDSNIGKAPLRFRLGGDKVIEGLNIGVEGMRVGEKRRLIIPPSLGYTKDMPTEDAPKNAWLVYEVEAVKVR